MKIAKFFEIDLYLARCIGSIHLELFTTYIFEQAMYCEKKVVTMYSVEGCFEHTRLSCQSLGGVWSVDCMCVSINLSCLVYIGKQQAASIDDAAAAGC